MGWTRDGRNVPLLRYYLLPVDILLPILFLPTILYGGLWFSLPAFHREQTVSPGAGVPLTGKRDGFGKSGTRRRCHTFTATHIRAFYFLLHAFPGL